MDLLQIPRVVDISAVRTDVTMNELDEIVELAKQHRFVCVFAMPCFTKYFVEKFRNDDDIMVGGVVGFPSGADTTSIKVATAKEMIAAGVDELDMVINVGALKSGMYDLVKYDIEAVVKAANGMPVKAILEIAYLTDEEIVKGSQLAVEAGVTFVKTGTGWGNKPTTVETIKLIKSTIGDKAYIKAAGGVRDLDTLLAMIDAGCNRFGIGIKSIMSILEEIYKREGKEMPQFAGVGAANDNY